jgi:23S rRNA (adenine2503-C2)-methyltransferase
MRADAEPRLHLAPPLDRSRGRKAIHGCSRDVLAECFRRWGEPGWRLDQLLHWLYAKHVAGWDEMSNLPRALRQRLGETFDFRLPELGRRQGSADSTRKFLWRLADGALIESVLIPANPALYGERADRHTLCVSTQVGCAFGCRFCASGLDGWKRNLGPDEIVGQVIAVERLGAALVARSPRDSGSAPNPPVAGRTRPGSAMNRRRQVDNLVIMGMGEPLANYDHLLGALRILNAPWGGAIGARKITLSTSGLVPQIRRLAQEPEQFRLAISLHGATDDVRNRIMPVNRKYPLKELIAACEEYLERKGRMLTLEYILLGGVNDRLDHVRPLAGIARRLHAKVNLIPYNRVEGLPWIRPADEHCHAFASALQATGVATTLRIEKGHDIDAACGQLRLRTEGRLPRQLEELPTT